MKGEISDEESFIERVMMLDQKSWGGNSWLFIDSELMCVSV